jgi:hypothetical protein
MWPHLLPRVIREMAEGVTPKIAAIFFFCTPLSASIRISIMSALDRFVCGLDSPRASALANRRATPSVNKL